ncbi:MAG: NupC/NupG family nucleoside CNT transporter [Ignavibacteriaceae bacterium]|jgi:CNT family concentrative nucleoside transporter|nr:NupC/NupG family nucleoside CNT transporter [Ignavibacteriaceae bacterium]
MDIVSVLRGIIGVGVLLGIAFLLSNNKRNVNWKLVIGGLSIQLVLAFFLIKGEAMSEFFSPFGWVKDLFSWVGSFFVVLLQYSEQGASFVFGNLAISPGKEGSLGFFFAFQVLPTIIFFAALMSILYYLGIMQKVVQAMAWVMAKIMGTSGAESLSCTANIFVGQTEAPLIIKPYLEKMTKSEMLTVMTGGMATIAGGVMAAYIQMLGQSYAAAKGVSIEVGQQLFATQLLSASVLAAPAALLISKIIFPESEVPATRGSVKMSVEKNGSNVIEAASNGAIDGLHLALNVGGMLIAFICLIAVMNGIFTWAGEITGLNAVLMEQYGKPLNFQLLIGFILQPVAFAIGIPFEDALNFGSLLGTKTVLNEFVAYLDLAKMIELKEIINPKVIFMSSYALCGFANFSSIAIQVGGIGALAPSRKADLAQLGIKAVIGGTLSTLLSATFAGMFF